MKSLDSGISNPIYGMEIEAKINSFWHLSLLSGLNSVTKKSNAKYEIRADKKLNTHNYTLFLDCQHICCLRKCQIRTAGPGSYKFWTNCLCLLAKHHSNNNNNTRIKCWRLYSFIYLNNLSKTEKKITIFIFKNCCLPIRLPNPFPHRITIFTFIQNCICPFIRPLCLVGTKRQ